MNDILPQVLAALSPLLLALVAWAAKKVADLINAKVQSDTLRNVLVRLETVVFVAVKEVAQVSVDTAKQASMDGKIPADVAKAAKEAALAKVMSYLGQPGLDLLMQALGLKDMATTEAFLTSKIEAAVRDTKLAP